MVSIGNDLPTSYLWTNGDTLQTFNASASATYTVTVVNSIGCTSTSEPIEIVENPNPIVTSGPDMYSSTCNPTYVISGGSPVGGYYSGTGIQNGILIHRLEQELTMSNISILIAMDV
ncbi:MAG: hypothetical protein IPP27_15705 [Bacteroidetes bacterium]|nr:hypothetical protein [Bacteroidota bacterium]